jgi:hypothetical protein
VVAVLPGFSLENITSVKGRVFSGVLMTDRDYSVALKRHGSLHILADKYDDGLTKFRGLAISDPAKTTPKEGEEPGEGHFECMVELGADAIGSVARAEYDGSKLTVRVRKKTKDRH